MECPYCGKSHPEEAAFCPTTGRRLICPSCGEHLPPGAKFCPFCQNPVAPATKPKARIPLLAVCGGLLLIFLLAGLAFGMKFFQTKTAAPTLAFPPINTRVQPFSSSIPASPITSQPTFPSATDAAFEPPTPQPAATPENTNPAPISAGYQCGDKNQLELRVGATGVVQNYKILLVREPVDPTGDFARTVRVIESGEKIHILAGPTCKFGISWWQVADMGNNTGLVRETDQNNRRLIALEGPSTPSTPPTQKPGNGSAQKRDQDGMTMVFVPSGSFTMGSNNGAIDEKPVHTVTLDGYWIDQTEVTNAMFRAFVSQTSYRTDAENIGQSIIFNPNAKSFYEISSGADWQHLYYL